MADNVKVFTHIDAQTTTGDISIVTTDAETQAVVKDVIFKGKSTHYPTEMTLKLNDILLGETYTSGPDEELNVGLSGNLIMDATSILKVSIPTVPQVDYVAKLDAVIFSDNYNQTLRDINLTPIESTTPYTNTDVESHLQATGQGGTNNPANCAFAVIRNSEVQYFRYWEGDLFRHHDGAAPAETAITVLDGSGNAVSSYSMCTDGTFFYEKSSSTSTEIRVYNVSDYVPQTSITTDVSYSGQASNQGSYMLTHGGYIYTKHLSVDTIIYKTNIEDGTTTTINVNSVGNYSGGAVITRGSDTEFYLVEKGSNGWYKVNLATDLVVNYAGNGGMNETTEYGNNAFEISGGYVGVIDGLNIVVINVVEGTYARTSGNGSTNGGYFSSISNTFGSKSAVAALSISANFDSRPHGLNYSIYASGVEIT
jgi:hypothetical protein